jgi:hypothetical protein
MQGLAYFTVFLLPAVALYGFLQGGAWAWAFVPALGGLACAEVGACMWKRHARYSAGRALARSEEAK